MTVRISATDWAEGGTTAEDAVEIARAFAAHGADAIDVSTGQVVADERPEYGRSYQTPYADRIRNDLVVPGHRGRRHLLLGRRQLPAPGGPRRPVRAGPPPSVRPALDPARGGRAGLRRPGRAWPRPYRAGSRTPPTGRTDAPKPRLTLCLSEAAATGTGRHAYASGSRDSVSRTSGVLPDVPNWRPAQPRAATPYRHRRSTSGDPPPVRRCPSPSLCAPSDRSRSRSPRPCSDHRAVGRDTRSSPGARARPPGELAPDSRATPLHQ